MDRDAVSELLDDLYGDANQRARSSPRASSASLAGPVVIPLAKPLAIFEESQRAPAALKTSASGEGLLAMSADPVAATLRRGYNASLFNAALRKSHLQKLTPHEQLDATRDERIQARWERQQAAWAAFKARTSAQLDRDVSSSILSNAEGYRTVQEELRLIERAAPKDDVLCADNWMATLRDSGR